MTWGPTRAWYWSYARPIWLARVRLAEVAEQAVKVGAKVLWLQDGIVNEDAWRIAQEGGIDVVMGVCIRRTKRRLEREAS